MYILEATTAKLMQPSLEKVFKKIKLKGLHFSKLFWAIVRIVTPAFRFPSFLKFFPHL